MRLYGGIHYLDKPCLSNAERLDMLFLPMLVRMMRNGMAIDPGKLQALSVRLDEEMEALTQEIEDLTGERINVGSPDQVADLLFKGLKLKYPGKIRMTKSGDRESVDEDVLQVIAAQHPAVVKILDYRERQKLKGTYCENLVRRLDPAGRIHTQILYTRTGTGRLASKDPNLQNIPVRTNLGKEIRNAFVPAKGLALGTIDLSQIEVRMVAHDSECENLLDVYVRNDDVYWATAEKVFHRTFSKEERKSGVTPTTHLRDGDICQLCGTGWSDRIAGKSCNAGGLSYKEQYRFPCKTITLATIYLITPPGLANQMAVSHAVGWTEERCGQAIGDFFDEYPEVLKRFYRHQARARQYEYVWTWAGRIRRIPECKSVHPKIQEEGKRKAANTPIQGGAGDILKLGMAKIWYELLERGWADRVQPILQVHDELLFEGEKSALEEFLPLCVEVFENLLPNFLCPLRASWAVSGDSWGSLEK